MPLMARGARDAGCRAKYARLAHSTSHDPRATPRPTARPATNGAAAVPVGGPQQDREQRVEDHRAGSAVERAGVAGEHRAEPFAEPPHPQRPRHRGAQREPGRGPPGDPEAQRQLDGRENGVHRDQMMIDKGRRPGNRAGHDGGIPGRGTREHLREPLAEHERLVLQDAVQQPDDRQGQLQLAAQVQYCQAALLAGQGGAGRRLGHRAADREALAHVQVPPGDPSPCRN